MATEVIKKITALKLAGIITFTGIGAGVILKLNRKNLIINEPTTNYTWEVSNTNAMDFENIETTFNTTEETETKHNYASDNTHINSTNVVNSDSEDDYIELYNFMLNELKKTMNDKHIDDETQKIVIEYFDKVYENYDSFYEVYKINGMPTKKEYIEKMIIENLEKNIDAIYLQDGVKVGLIQQTVVGNYNDGFIRLDKNTAKPVDYGHEANHATKGKLDPMKLKGDLYKVFVEGEATWSEAICNNSFSVASPIIFHDNSKSEGYCIKGLPNKDKNYILYSKCYGMLASIVDYKTLQGIKKEGNIDNIVNYINNNYSIDGNDLLNEMVNLCNYYTLGNEQKICESLKKLEITMNKCFFDKLSKIETPDELISFINMKRYYDMQYSTEILKNYKNNESFDIVKNNGLDPYNINDLLYQKSIEYNIFPKFSDDENKNRQIFGSIMGEGEDSKSFYSKCESIQIKELSYSLSEDENVLTLYDCSTPIVQHNYSEKKTYMGGMEIDNSYLTNEPYELIAHSNQKTI